MDVASKTNIECQAHDLRCDRSWRRITRLEGEGSSQAGRARNHRTQTPVTRCRTPVPNRHQLARFASDPARSHAAASPLPTRRLPGRFRRWAPQLRPTSKSRRGLRRATAKSRTRRPCANASAVQVQAGSRCSWLAPARCRALLSCSFRGTSRLPGEVEDPASGSVRRQKMVRSCDNLYTMSVAAASSETG